MPNARSVPANAFRRGSSYGHRLENPRHGALPGCFSCERKGFGSAHATDERPVAHLRSGNRRVRRRCPPRRGPNPRRNRRLAVGVERWPSLQELGQGRQFFLLLVLLRAHGERGAGDLCGLHDAVYHCAVAATRIVNRVEARSAEVVAGGAGGRGAGVTAAARGSGGCRGIRFGFRQNCFHRSEAWR